MNMHDDAKFWDSATQSWSEWVDIQVDKNIELPANSGYSLLESAWGDLLLNNNEHALLLKAVRGLVPENPAEGLLRASVLAQLGYPETPSEEDA